MYSRHCGLKFRIAASTVSIVNMCTVSIVCILAVGTLGIGNGVIVTVCFV